MDDGKRTSADPLEGRLGFETLIAELSSRFVRLAPREADHQVEDALARVCGFVGVDFAVLWQWSAAAPDRMLATHAYPPLANPTTAEPPVQSHYPWIRRQLLAGRTVVVSSLAELPQEASVDRANALRAGIKSLVCLPLELAGEPSVGALAFNTLKVEREWPQDLILRLRLVAQLFTHALARKRSEELLASGRARLEAGVDLAGLAFYEVDLDGRSVFVDERFRALCGIPRERESGIGALEFWMERLHPDDRERVIHLRRELHEGRVQRVNLYYRFLNPARGERWIHHVACVSCRDEEGRAIKTFGVARDVTDQKHAEEELHDQSQRLIRAHEDERALLARELHDDLSQRLAVLAIQAGRAEREVTDKAVAETMRVIREEIARLSDDVHALAYQLHPSVLDELGLAEALRAECERLGRRSGIAIRLELDPIPAALGKAGALCLFRIAQEALANVLRHANARAASVALRQGDGGMSLAVRDDGVGFDPERPGRGRHLGLASMRERVRVLHGAFDMESAPGRGTAILAWIPLGKESP